jgi:hypothetical protein
MNYTFDKYGWLILDGFAIQPYLTKKSFLCDKLYERYGDVQAYEYYILGKRLVNRDTNFIVTVVFEDDRLHWTEIHREENRGIANLSVLTQLKEDMLHGEKDTFDWGDVSMPGIEPEDKAIIIRYKNR